MKKEGNPLNTKKLRNIGKLLKYNPYNSKITNKKLILIPVLTAIMFFSFATSGSMPKSDLASVYAQTDNNNNNQTANLGQLESNLTQAREALAAGGNSTETIAQLTSIIGELSDQIATLTSEQNGQYHDEHTHVFTHKDHTHTVTHKHPHNNNHHQDWTERHHIFNPSHCTPGLMC